MNRISLFLVSIFLLLFLGCIGCGNRGDESNKRSTPLPPTEDSRELTPRAWIIDNKISLHTNTDIPELKNIIQAYLATKIGEWDFIANSQAEGRKARILVAVNVEKIPHRNLETQVIVSVEGGIAFIGNDYLEVEYKIVYERSRPTKELGPKAQLDVVTKALYQWALGIQEREELRIGGISQIRSALLKEEDPDILLAALERAQLLGDKSLIPQISPLLSHHYPPIRHRAVGVMVALGGVSIIPQITKEVSFSDHGQLSTVIEALSISGGQESEVFLNFVIEGHSNPEIVQKATDALQRIRLKAKGKSKSALGVYQENDRINSNKAMKRNE